ncbi:hypothetical protein T4C_8179 [Trichinella pseudospiralis]|uniref:Uncharacterized protein n=1 Tax=Trichinella pseudospiralis TaxID=6337 RepID=A0A0V1IPK5_TRIPS|nr:hypothetical protein T4C_8179 [Trichinella pseudospiralis]
MRQGFASPDNVQAVLAGLRLKTSSGSARVSLVAAKTRVNPVKRLSLLRFERIRILAAARLNRFVQEGLQLDNAPLHAGVAVRSRWHGCGRRLAVGVRVLETLSGKSNPDDLLSGGASLKRLARSSY